MLQIIAASSTREAWQASARGLSASDMTMQIVLPEFDGRIAIGPIAFKEEALPDPLLGYTGRRQSPFPDGMRAPPIMLSRGSHFVAKCRVSAGSP